MIARKRRRVWILCVFVLVLVPYLAVQSRHGTWTRYVSVDSDREELSQDDLELPQEDAVLQPYRAGGRDNGYIPSRPLVTLVTTMDHIGGNQEVYVNTLRNWDALHPAIMPVLILPNMSADIPRGYTKAPGEIDLYTLVKRHTRHWRVIWTTDYVSSTPPKYVINTLLETLIQAGYSTPLVGYSHNSVLFDASLVATVTHLRRKLIRATTQPFLVTGVPVELGQVRVADPGCLSCITRLSRTTNPGWSPEYFILDPATFPRHQIQRVMTSHTDFPGRFLWTATQSGVIVIDSSLTLFALRQTPRPLWTSHSGRNYPLESRAVKTWPSHVACPSALANRCLKVNTTIS